VEKIIKEKERVKQRWVRKTPKTFVNESRQRGRARTWKQIRRKGTSRVWKQKGQTGQAKALVRPELSRKLPPVFPDRLCWPTALGGGAGEKPRPTVDVKGKHEGQR